LVNSSPFSLLDEPGFRLSFCFFSFFFSSSFAVVSYKKQTIKPFWYSSIRKRTPSFNPRPNKTFQRVQSGHAIAHPSPPFSEYPGFFTLDAAPPNTPPSFRFDAADDNRSFSCLVLFVDLPQFTLVIVAHAVAIARGRISTFLSPTSL
jgi:hypothetical protein